MNVLIVDDELPAIEGIQSSVQWDKFGFKNIYIALSMKEAQIVFNRTIIDIMICDIEMPQGSGIELLQWVKANYPNVEAIFITAHADFKYAKQAVKLGCLDYILKPVITDELNAILDNAVNIVNMNKESIMYRQYGEFWLQNKPLVEERFWLDLLNNSILGEPEAIKKAAAERSIPYQENTSIIPILIKIQRWYKELDPKSEKIMEMTICSQAENSIKELNYHATVIPVEKGTLIALIDITEKNANHTALIAKIESFIAKCNNSYYSDISVYVGKHTLVADLSAMVAKLHKMDKDNVSATNRVFRFDDYIPKTAEVKLPNFDVWSKMMTEGLKEPLIHEVEEYKYFISHESDIDSHFLTRLHQDLLQMMYYVLQVKGIQAHQLFNDEKSLEMAIKASRTIFDMFAWLNHVIEKSFIYIDDVQKSDSILDKVNRYINQHIGDDMTREELANYVYLNPDYLTRLVKKETGLPISEYIQWHRMELAKELLKKTELKISSIALQVGYKHFSQFSKIFKKYTNMTPIEYRHDYIRIK